MLRINSQVLLFRSFLQLLVCLSCISSFARAMALVSDLNQSFPSLFLNKLYIFFLLLI